MLKVKTVRSKHPRCPNEGRYNRISMSCTLLIGLNLGSETHGFDFSKLRDFGEVTQCL